MDVNLLIGMDEAGYGPNLGPLVITATVWYRPEQSRRCDLWDLLKGTVAPLKSNAARVQRGDGPHSTLPRRGHTAIASSSHSPVVVIDDSKRVYSSSQGLAVLEEGVLCLVGASDSAAAGRAWESSSDELPLRLGELLASLGVKPTEEFQSQPWYDDVDLPLPRCVDVSQLTAKMDRLQSGMQQAGVRLLAICSEVVCPPRFNALLQDEDSKATVLSRLALRLLRRSWQMAGGGPALAIVDKHGGRNTYQQLLHEIFPEHFIWCHEESRARSRYQIPTPTGSLEFQFQRKAESHLPVAAASMVSKYLRELLMEPFNRFWTQRIPSLRPTAGYPPDARRFWTAIRPWARRLSLAETTIWRQR